MDIETNTPFYMLDPTMFGYPKGTDKVFFVMTASGSGMSNAGIQDQDTLICVSTTCVDDGDLAVVKVNGDVSLKRFYRSGEKILLKRESEIAEVQLVEDCTIIGKLIAIQRKV